MMAKFQWQRWIEQALTGVGEMGPPRPRGGFSFNAVVPTGDHQALQYFIMTKRLNSQAGVPSSVVDYVF